MPLTINQFYTNLRGVVARGDTEDAKLVVWARQTLKFLEREITFDYMKETYFLLLEPGSRYFNFAAATPAITAIKKVESLGYYGRGGGRIPLGRVSSDSIGAYSAPVPTRFRQSGTKLIFEGWLDPPGVSQETVSYPLILELSRFTDWPTDGTSTHLILDIAEDLMMDFMLLRGASSLRKQEDMNGWKLLRDEAFLSVRRYQDENETEGWQDAQMNYRGGTTGQFFDSTTEAIASIVGMYDLPDTFGVAGIYHVGA